MFGGCVLVPRSGRVAGFISGCTAACIGVRASCVVVAVITGYVADNIPNLWHYITGCIQTVSCGS